MFHHRGKSLFNKLYDGRRLNADLVCLTANLKSSLVRKDCEKQVAVLRNHRSEHYHFTFSLANLKRHAWSANVG